MSSRVWLPLETCRRLGDLTKYRKDIFYERHHTFMQSNNEASALSLNNVGMKGIASNFKMI